MFISYIYITSGVVQGSVVGSGLYTVSARGLVIIQNLPPVCRVCRLFYIDSRCQFKYYSEHIDSVSQYSDYKCTPIPSKNVASLLLYCGAEQPNRIHYK